MSLSVFTALVGLLVAPGGVHPVPGRDVDPVDRARRGGVGCAQHVVRCRHRPGDEAHAQAADPVGPRGTAAMRWRWACS